MSKKKWTAVKWSLGSLPKEKVDSSETKTDKEHKPKVILQSNPLSVLLDKKKRRGKIVTIIEGFEGTQDKREGLAKILKTKCGVGGAVKDFQIILQGNHRDKVMQLLKEMGYKVKRVGG